MPYWPLRTVVPLREPPVGMGTRPLCALRYFVRRGARSPRCLTCCCGPGKVEDDGVKRDEDARQGRCEARKEAVVVREEEAMGLALTGRDSEAMDLVSDCNSSEDDDGDSMAARMTKGVLTASVERVESSE